MQTIQLIRGSHLIKTSYRSFRDYCDQLRVNLQENCRYMSSAQTENTFIITTDKGIAVFNINKNPTPKLVFSHTEGNRIIFDIFI